jgi:hypothetical protein
LGRYEEAFWGNAGKVFVSFRSRQLRCASANSLLADLKLELDDDYSELLAGAAVRLVGKVRVEEKAKLKDRLLRAQSLLEHPLKAFADCLRCEVGNLQTQYVQDCPDLWEAAARWVSIFNVVQLQPCINNHTNRTLYYRDGCC